jgi:hypothetical protein
MKLTIQLVMMLKTYPLVILLAWYYHNWHMRVAKLRLLEVISTNKKIVFRMAALRIFALYFWGLVEIGSSIYMVCEYHDIFTPLTYRHVT